MTDVLVRIENLDGTTQVTRVTPSSPSFVVAAAPSALEVTRTYLVLGVEHILFGVDHLLFVLALLILVRDGANSSEPSPPSRSRTALRWQPPRWDSCMSQANQSRR